MEFGLDSFLCDQRNSDEFWWDAILVLVPISLSNGRLRMAGAEVRPAPITILASPTPFFCIWFIMAKHQLSLESKNMIPKTTLRRVKVWQRLCGHAWNLVPLQISLNQFLMTRVMGIFDYQVQVSSSPRWGQVANSPWMGITMATPGWHRGKNTCRKMCIRRRVLWWRCRFQTSMKWKKRMKDKTWFQDVWGW